jgi:CxxC motif-containing protein (DUF1111 family)
VRWTLRIGGLLLVLGVAALVSACTDGDPDPDASPTTAGGALPLLEPRQGGMTTTFDDTELAFAHPARNISLGQLRVFAAGDETFEASFAPEAAGDPREGGYLGGLGERFDAVGCTSCHVNDGRSPPPTGDGPLPVGMIAKLDTDDADVLDRYGAQLQRDAVGVAPEGAVTVTYQEIEGTYGDGTPYSLRRPTYGVTDLAHGALPEGTVLAVRSAPPLIGLGLLEYVAPQDVLAQADPADDDGDGISGRPGEAVVPFEDAPVLGRFGWQATAATVEHQTATALLHDIGVTTRWFPDERCQQPPRVCPPADGPLDPAALDVAPAVPVELGDQDLFDLVGYTLLLAVPAVRDVDDPEVRRGAAVFERIGCTSCHAGPITTGEGEIRGLSEQVIDPGTDLLLYDMGEDLADRTLAGEPVTTEWRAAPLWGLGLAELVAGGPVGYLHDSRARTVAEAILWHGGEGTPAREAFRTLPAAERDALLAYLAAR